MADNATPIKVTETENQQDIRRQVERVDQQLVELNKTAQDLSGELYTAIESAISAAKSGREEKLCAVQRQLEELKNKRRSLSHSYNNDADVNWPSVGDVIAYQLDVGDDRCEGMLMVDVEREVSETWRGYLALVPRDPSEERMSRPTILKRNDYRLKSRFRAPSLPPSPLHTHDIPF